MTLLDMLDQLEAEIVSLRGRLADLERNHRPAPAKRKPTKKKAKPQSKRKEIKPEPTEQLSLAVTSDEAAKPVLGKRQALGRSIVQLRRPAATNG